MFILSRTDTVPVKLSTLWGEEEGVYYKGVEFLPLKVYKNLNEAIAACQKDLEVGLFSIVIADSNKASLWSPLPKQMQTAITLI